MALGIVLVWLLLWSFTRAEEHTAPVSPADGSTTAHNHPAHQQLKQLEAALLAGEAEQVSVAYLPGTGAIITIRLPQGAARQPGQPAHVGVQRWLLGQVETLGPQLAAVPPEETISFSVDFYEPGSDTLHQLVLSSQAASSHDPASYACWLNGEPCGDF
jgi:hypothetical protein